MMKQIKINNSELLESVDIYLKIMNRLNHQLR